MAQDVNTELIQSIRSSIARLLAKELPQYTAESYYNTVPRKLFSALAELGLAGLAVPESYGGLAASPVLTMAVMEELAAANLGPAIFTSVHTMVSGIIARHGSSEQQQAFLPKLASGEWLGAFALTEPSAGSDAAALKTTARIDGDSYLLNGEKCYITSAGFADVYVVFARTSAPRSNQTSRSGISAFIVTRDTPGLTISKPEKKMGCELSPIASLTFANAIVPQQHVLGSIDDGYRVALSGLAGGRINIAACANGLSRAALTKSLQHLSERRQFGQALAEFQGLQFMIADMKIRLDSALLLTERAAATLSENPNDLNNRLFPSIAKCSATDAAMSITTDAVQLLGGAGYIKEYEVERLMREAKMLQIVEGTNQVQRMVIARELFKAP